jgi:hypothetical protein
MNSNNINTLTFEHHDTYIWYLDEFINSLQIVKLTPTNPEDTDIVVYSSREAKLFTNGVNTGVVKHNGFRRSNLLDTNNPVNLTLGTIITNDGILMYNYATERAENGFTFTGFQTKSLATYKSGKYANYINVEIQIDREDTYRIVTISY